MILILTSSYLLYVTLVVFHQDALTDLTGQQEELSIEGTEITCYAHKVYNRTLFECSCEILLWEVSERVALVT